MTRNHIHCAVGLYGEDGVTSGMSPTSYSSVDHRLILRTIVGMRSNCDLYIYLDVPALLSGMSLSISLYLSVLSFPRS